MRRLVLIVVALASVLVVAACAPQQQIPPTPTATPRPTATPISVVEPNQTPTAEAEPTAEPGPDAYGPTDFPEDVNPLTGLEVDDPETLDRRPILIKVSNNPPFVRPQAGIQFADHMWEHQVEGYALTRFTAVIYGQSPERVGSVRSGRPPDLEMVPMYQGLYASSGFSTRGQNTNEPFRMREYMLNATWFDRNFSFEFGFGAPSNRRIPQEGLATEHTLFSIPEGIWEVAEERGVNERPTIEGLAFDPEPPAGGTPTEEFIIDYPGVGPRVTWRWDDDLGRWLRWSSNSQGEDEPHGDAITEEQVRFDNVVLIYALHYNTDWPEDFATGAPGVAIDLFGEGDAVILRDGQRYEVTWRREGSESENMIQFFDETGSVLPLAPGQTWFQVSSFGLDAPQVFFDGELVGAE